jgi:steroid delta-isomerase-like uncharacterized protein
MPQAYASGDDMGYKLWYNNKCDEVLYVCRIAWLLKFLRTMNMSANTKDAFAEGLWRGEITPDEHDDRMRNERLVSRIWDEIWNLGAYDVVDEVFDRDYVGHLPLMTVHGTEEFKNVVRTYRTAYPDVQLTADDVFSQGDRVAVRWMSRGTHLGEMMGVPPSGKRIEVMGISLFRIAEGKVIEEWEGFDTYNMMRTIGAIPS